MATSSNQAHESGIIRTVHDRGNQFAQINRALLQNSALSWEARGLMGYLLSKPEDWEVRFTDLVKQGPGEADRMRRILKELESAGHLVRKRDHGPRGRWVWITAVYENPADAQRDMEPCAGFPYMVEPHTEKPDTDFPDMENRHIYKDKKRTKKESTNTDTTNTRESAPAARDIAPTGRKLTPGVNAPKPTPATPLPRDWAFDPDLREWAITQRGLTPDQADDEHDQFCAHYLSIAHDRRLGQRTDWLAAEYSWFFKREQFAPKQKGTYRDNLIPPDKLTAKLQGIGARIATLNGAADPADEDVSRLRAFPAAR